MDTTQLINEATIDYTRNMNKLAFDALARRGRSELAGLALVQLVPEHFAWPAPAQVRHPAGNMFRALHALPCWLWSHLVNFGSMRPTLWRAGTSQGNCRRPAV